MTFDRRTVLAYLITGTFVAVLLIMLLYPLKDMDETVKNMLLMLLGALVAKVGDVFSFDFGSSDGSKKKDDALIAAAETPQMARRREAVTEPTAPMTVTVEKQEIEAEIKP